jgi:cyclase
VLTCGRIGGGRVRAVRVIPCLDVDAGRVVKGVRFADLRDAGDPVSLAVAYDAQGADEIVFYDITASAERRQTMVEVVARTAEQVFIPLAVGGGVRSLDDARRLLRVGADKVSVNTAAVERPRLVEEVAAEFGSQCVVLGVDVRRCSHSSAGGIAWEVWTHGGRRPTGLDALSWIAECAGRGAGEVVLNSMDRDGTRDGYDLDLIAAVCATVDIPVVASGGVGGVEHMVEGALAGADAVLAASIFHFGEATVADAKAAMSAAGVVVRSPNDELEEPPLRVAGNPAGAGADNPGGASAGNPAGAGADNPGGAVGDRPSGAVADHPAGGAASG